MSTPPVSTATSASTPAGFASGSIATPLANKQPGDYANYPTLEEITLEIVDAMVEEIFRLRQKHSELETETFSLIEKLFDEIDRLQKENGELKRRSVTAE